MWFIDLLVIGNCEALITKEKCADLNKGCLVLKVMVSNFSFGQCWWFLCELFLFPLLFFVFFLSLGSFCFLTFGFSAFLSHLLVFPGSPFPWQTKVLVSVFVTSPDLFRVALRYSNRAGSAVWGRVSVIEDGRSYYCGNCEWEWGKKCIFSVFLFT